MTLIISIVVFLLAVIGFGLAMRRFRDSSKPAPQAPPRPAPKTEPKPPEVEWALIQEALLQLNFAVRKDPDLPPATLLQIEGIIDDLKSAIPPMMERYPGETLTYEVKKNRALPSGPDCQGIPGSLLRSPGGTGRHLPQKPGRHPGGDPPGKGHHR